MQAPIDTTPCFLVGATRSGTSLLGLMLGAHPDIAFAGEFEYAVDFMPDGAPPALPAYHDWLSMNRHYRHHRPAIDPALPFPDLVRSFLAQMRQQAGADKRLVVVSVHRHFDRLQRLWPEARYVHLVRDPRDVARSWMEFGWVGNAWAAGRTWAELERLWLRVATELPRERVHELRFEDLVRDPPGALKALCGFLGVDYAEHMLEYHRRSSYGPVDPGQVAKWRTALRPDEQRWIEGGAGDLLARHGYESAGLPPLVAGPLASRWLALDDRWRRMRSRQRHFGMRIWLSDQVAKLLHLEGWRRRLELERQAIINRGLK